MSINFFDVGRVGRDAELRFTQGGEPVLGWSIAVDSGYGDKKQTLWFDCSLWGKRAESLAQYIRKGDQIGIVGEIGEREHDGKTYKTVRVSEVKLIGGKRDDNTGAGSSRAPQQVRTQTPQDEFSDEVPF